MENQKGHNNKKTKTIILSICALLAVGIGVFLTYSYLNTMSNEVKNTFTVGNITASIDELAIGGTNGRQQAFVLMDTNNITCNPATETNTLLGSEPGENTLLTTLENTIDDNNNTFVKYRTNANRYKLSKGCKYYKDPIIHIESNSNNATCAVFLKIKNPLKDCSNEFVENQLKMSTQRVVSDTTNYQWNEMDFAGIVKPSDTNGDPTGSNLTEKTGFDYYYLSSKNTMSITFSKNVDITTFNSIEITDDKDLPNGETQIIVKAAVIEVNSNDTLNLKNLWSKCPPEFKET